MKLDVTAMTRPFVMTLKKLTNSSTPSQIPMLAARSAGGRLQVRMQWMAIKGEERAREERATDKEQDAPKTGYELVGVDADFGDVVHEGKERAERERGHEQRDEAKLQ